MVLLVSLVALKCHRDTKRTIFPVPLAPVPATQKNLTFETTRSSLQLDYIM